MIKIIVVGVKHTQTRCKQREEEAVKTKKKKKLQERQSGGRGVNCSPAPVMFNQVKRLHGFHGSFSLRSWIIVNKILSMAAPLWPIPSHGGDKAALPLSHVGVILYSKMHILHTNACLVGVLSFPVLQKQYLHTFFWSTLYNDWLTHTHSLVFSRSPLASSSCMHMSTTIGLLVLWALTSVVRSQLYTFLTCRRSGWQSFGTTLEHCLWTFSPQSDRERQIVKVNLAIEIKKNHCSRKSKRRCCRGTVHHSNNHTDSVFFGTKLSLLIFKIHDTPRMSQHPKWLTLSLLSHIWVTV